MASAGSILRRTAPLLVALGLAAPLAAPAAAAAKGPYGTADPKNDGVWRTSIAMLAQRRADYRPAAGAVAWLKGQQCTDGGFTAYRADTAKPCATKKLDTNATAAAVQALAALGEKAAVRKAVGWLESVQNKDGGWGYNPGGATDANSTGVVMGALTAARTEPDAVTSKAGRTPADGLATLALGCKAAKDKGAYAYQPDKGRLFANDYATAAAALAASGSGFAVPGAGADEPVAAACSEKPAEAAAGYLAGKLGKGGGHLIGFDGKTPDNNATAVATLALAAAGHKSAALKPYAWLAKNSATWSKGSPAALGMLVLTAQAVGRDPRAIDGMDAVARLNATGPAPEKIKHATGAAVQKDDDDGGLSATTWTIIAVGLVAGVGGGLLASLRRRKQS